MAGGKMTPRQKMVSLMYLVFIAMLALQMSKEVLSAFGSMNEKFEGVNVRSEKYIKVLYKDLATKAEDNPTQFGEPFEKAKKAKVISNDLFAFIDTLKKDIESGYDRDEKTNMLPYEAMDKGDMVDEKWFAGDGYSKKGKEIIGKIEGYKKDLLKLFGDDIVYKEIADNIRETFDTSDIKDGDGAMNKYLTYHFKGFPSVASLTKLSAMQSDVKKVEQDIYNILIGNTSAVAASMKNYQAMVITDKPAFFAGDNVTGRIVLGRYDENTVPSKVIVNDNEIDIAKSLKGGQVYFDFKAGSIGEHDINGQFVFKEGGKEVPIAIEDKYVVIPRPKSATISADKMNVVYRGVKNPLTISFAGVPDNKVNARAPGLVKIGSGKYVMDATKIKSRKVTINVTAQIDGKTVADKKVFRIKGIPSPLGSIRGETGKLKGPKSSLKASKIGAELVGFDFELDLRVSQFNIKIPNQPTMVIKGNRLDARAKKALNRAKRGDQITISEIKAKIPGRSYIPPKTSPVIYEITN